MWIFKTLESFLLKIHAFSLKNSFVLVWKPFKTTRFHSLKTLFGQKFQNFSQNPKTVLPVTLQTLSQITFINNIFWFHEIFSKILWFLAHWPTQFRSLKSSYSSAYSVLTSVTAKISLARNGNFQNYAIVIQNWKYGFANTHHKYALIFKTEDHINCALSLHDRTFLAYIEIIKIAICILASNN